MPHTLSTLPTPAIIINLAIVKKNLAKMAAYCREHNLNLRPHFKTHKSLRMAQFQIDAGSPSITYAKVGEIQTIQSLYNDILLAYPALDPERTAILADLAHSKTIRVAIDSTLAADRLAQAAQKANSTIGILVDIDVGFHRTGLQSPQLALNLAQHIAQTKNLRLDGLMCYPGHIQLPAIDQPPALAPINDILQSTLALFQKSGLPASIVSGGSSPTSYQSHLIPALTEIRPGTYIYNDRNMLAGNFCNLEDCAARILATIVSDAVPNKRIIDAGSKVLSSDRLHKAPDTAGHGLIPDHPTIKIARLSEEHGELDISQSPNPPQLGDRISLIPNHICPCINLANQAWLQLEDQSLEPLPINARGQVV